MVYTCMYTHTHTYICTWCDGSRLPKLNTRAHTHHGRAMQSETALACLNTKLNTKLNTHINTPWTRHAVGDDSRLLSSTETPVSPVSSDMTRRFRLCLCVFSV